MLLLPAQNRQKYDGPRPEKKDVLYLLHARNLVATDVGEAREEKVKDGLKYTLGGAAARARTPLMEPIFLLDAEKLVPEKISCWRMTVKNGQRELLVPTKPKKDSERPRRVMITSLGDRLVKIELTEPLDNGEYVLSPDGSNQVFAFTIY